MRLALASGALTVIVAAAVGITLLTRSTPVARADTPVLSTFNLPGLNDATLAGAGISLREPSTTAVPVGKQQAMTAASDLTGGVGTPVSAELASAKSTYARDLHDPHGFDAPRLCWVVLVKLPTGQTIHGPANLPNRSALVAPQTNMQIVLVDALTGKVIFGVRGGDLPSLP
jgi:hypothetical protein